jgi:hypothetical protein
VRLDSDETPDDSDWFRMILDRVIQYLIGWADRLAEALQAVQPGGSIIPPRCRHRVGTV